jgi:Ca-activated chloride channel homolog
MMSPKALIVSLVTVLMFGCGMPPAPSAVAQPKAAPVQMKQEAKVWPDVLSVKNASVVPDPSTKNYILVFDGSGSMGDVACGGGRPRIEPAKEAALTWMKSIPKDANVGLVAFHTQQGHWTKLPLSKDREAFTKAIKSVRAGGNTPLATAFNQAFNDLTFQAQYQGGYGDYTIVTITDGEADNIGALSQWVEYILKISPIQIYTIGFCIQTNHTLSQPGKTTYRSANNPEELAKGLKDVLAEAEDFVMQDFRK